MNSSTPAEVWSCIAALARKFIAKLWVLTILHGQHRLHPSRAPSECTAALVLL
jgi:hypothetical protein